MARRIFKGRHIIYGLLSYVAEDPDTVRETKTSKSVDKSEFEESGKDRVLRIFKVDEFNNISPELNIIINTTYMSMFIGALYGGVMNSRLAYMDFIKNNQATVYKDHLEAKKRLQDKVTLSFGKGAFQWGWRLTAFTGTYITISTVLSTYRGDSGILEHTIAGGAAGLLYKFKLGPRASFVGGGFGLILGTIAGLCTVGLCKLTGIDMNEVRYWQYKWRQTKVDLENKSFEIHAEKSQLDVLKQHNKIHGKSGNLDSVIVD